MNKQQHICVNVNPLQLIIDIGNPISIIVGIFIVLNAIAIVVLVSIKDAIAVIVIILVSCVNLTVTIRVSVSPSGRYTGGEEEKGEEEDEGLHPLIRSPACEDFISGCDLGQGKTTATDR